MALQFMKVGDKVRLTRDESKVGIIRYIGSADFGPGEWFGIELEPGGINLFSFGLI